ncbi:unnamed protein product [Rotaria sp. Silwood1]|nr:unnamed protein product [Rotaria sp. Silwood1]
MSTTRKRYLEWKNRSLLPQLPIEIWAHIFSYLKISDLLSIRLVSRLFYSSINQYTNFWSLIIFDIDQCPLYLVQSKYFHNIRSSNINLFTKTNIYSHCNIYLKTQPLINSTNKRRKQHLFISNNNNDEQLKKHIYLHCYSIYFESLRSFDQLQLEYLLKKFIKRLYLSYEFLSIEPSLNFLLKLEQLKYLKISFIHNIIELDSYSIMLINTMSDIINLLFKLKSLCIVSLVGDCLCFGRPLTIYTIQNMYLRSLTDNLTHGLVSVFATSFLFGWTQYSLLIIAFLSGCFIDIDHFIEIRSLSLNSVLHNQRQDRPFLHNSLLLLIITLIVYIFEYFLYRNQYSYYSIIFFLGWSTHHLRDAQRRGLTLLPLGETSPINNYLLIICFVLITIKLIHIFIFNIQSVSFVNDSIV